MFVHNSPTWKLKLAEKTIGDRMIVATMWYGDQESPEHYCERMICIPDQSQLAEWAIKSMLPYYGNTVVVNDREFPIYNAQRDLMPCDNAPIIELSELEVENWCSLFNNGCWGQVDDEIFLK